LPSPENGKRPCLRTTNNVKKHPRFQGNPLAGFYLTTEAVSVKVALLYIED
jgi:hypothetical protein